MTTFIILFKPSSDISYLNLIYCFHIAHRKLFYSALCNKVNQTIVLSSLHLKAHDFILNLVLCDIHIFLCYYFSSKYQVINCSQNIDLLIRKTKPNMLSTCVSTSSALNVNTRSSQ